MRESSLQQRHTWYGSGHHHHFTDKMRRAFMKSPAICTVALCLLVGAFFFTRVLDSPLPNSKPGNFDRESIQSTATFQKYPHVTYGNPPRPRRHVDIPLNCAHFNLTGTCPRNYPTTFESEDDLDRPTCPEYFRWIHEDLRPWSRTGITRDMVERAKQTANFRLVIVDGKAYVETFEKGFQSRDIFTVWGILQLLRRYPGKVPDLELMFDCVDWPVVLSSTYSGPEAQTPPPLFRYCGDNATLDIVFPDWSFWGWPEINIKPWDTLLQDLKEGNKRSKWEDREPYAYWKGNPDVAATRQDLLKCNVSEGQDWNARLYRQDWLKEIQEGYKKSDLTSQCLHRYKIYIEGSAWSVSEKYILACDSVTFIVKPHYYDFFTRSLMPGHHYWPIREDDKCKSIKYAVDWGNSHKYKVRAIGKAAGQFIHEELKMDYVYDYMFHLLNEYSKLLTFKPEIPKNAIEFCSESMQCKADDPVYRKFMMESRVKGPKDGSPCTMPPPYDPATLHKVLRRKESFVEKVEMLEKKFWDSQDNKAAIGS